MTIAVPSSSPRSLRSSLIRSSLAALIASTWLGSSVAQPAATATPSAATAAPEFQPQSGQPGKDVVWVPTPQALVDRMLDMAGVTTADRLIDLGSGDGRTVITAAKRGLSALGIEYNPDMVALSRRNAQAEGVADRAQFVQGDIFESDFSKATVITLFLLPNLNLRLRPILLDMAPGTRVVSNSFDMGDWQSDESIDAGGSCVSWCRAFKWVIPAKVAGSWKLGSDTLTLEQTFQMLSGTLNRDGKSLPISDARMNGSAISFTAGGRKYTGQVAGNTMSGTVDGSAWSSTRVAN